MSFENLSITAEPNLKEKVESLDPETAEAVKEGIKRILSYEQERFYIDEGGVGKLYHLPGGLCIKILDERHNHPQRHLFDLGNEPKEESDLQNKMSRTKYDGLTRSPYVFSVFVAESREEKNAIVMEELSAVNMQHVINGRESLPDNFSLNSFFSDLADFLDHMHTTDQIAHTDLYARNIMIDKETGEPRVIDYGRAKDLSRINDEEKEKLIDEDWRLYDETYEK
ncbi:protein kinase, partial [Candidatus Nomurabacteria bacterium]|nr:protein kinase [Candidatus Nomurabacteria bacterium]